jgi:carboxypeptidase PM20D1
VARLKKLSILGAAVATLAGVRRVLRSRRPSTIPAALPTSEDEAVADRLAELVRIETVSYDDRPPNAEAFRALHAWLQGAYPKVHGALEREVVAEHSLLYTWRGSGEDRKPILLMAHLDVVPIEPGTEGEWEHPPFAADRSAGYLWGRGTMDDKASVVGIFEGIERLVGEGFQPDRTVFLAFGHDEEIGGLIGAKGIADLLAARGVSLELVLDEGGFVADGIIPGVRRPVAMVGTAEKGFLTVELSAEGQGGHSSAPPPQTAVGIVAAAVARLERRPLPARLEAIQKLLAVVAPEMPLLPRAVVSNAGLLAPLLERRLARSPMSDALIRSTTAVTMIQGGVKQNVLPRRARAVVNFRILPGDSVASVLQHVRDVIRDSRVEVAPLTEFPPVEPARESSTGSAAFAALALAIGKVFPEAVVAPWTLTGMTDSRHYAPLAEHVYRFAPFRWLPEDRQRVHGTNERIRLDDCSKLARFYEEFVRGAGSLEPVAGTLSGP